MPSKQVLDGGAYDPVSDPYNVDALGTRITALEMKIRDLIASKEESISTAQLAIDLRSELSGTKSELLSEINRIRGQITIDYQGASTVVEAFHDLDQATQSKIDRVRADYGRAAQQVIELQNSSKKDGLEIVYTADWAWKTLTAYVLKDVISQRPKSDRANPPIDDAARQTLIDEMRRWIMLATSLVPYIRNGDTIRTSIITAQHLAEEQVRRIPVNERNGIDGIVFRDFFVTASQCDAAEKALSDMVEAIRSDSLSMLSTFRDKIGERSQK